MAAARLQILGDFSLRIPGREDATPGPRKARALLGYLALTPGGAPRSRLAALLWGDATESGARTSLRQCLSAVRRGLGPQAADWLETDGDRVALRPQVLTVDALELRDANAETCLADLRRSIALYRGPVLEGLCTEEAAFEHWRRGEQAQVREALERLTLAAVQRARDDGEEHLALRLALALVNADWTRESAHQLVMEGYARTGQLATARAHFQRFREQLAANLHTQPSPATLQVFRNLDALSRGTVDGPAAPETVPEPPESATQPQRRQVYAMFVRAADPDDGAPESQHAALALLWEAAHSAAASQGADACHPESDGLLALWGSRSARGDEAERALRAAEGLHSRLADNGVVGRSSIGIAAGLVVAAPELQPPWIGAPIGQARRLAARAEPGAIELCPETRVSLRSEAKRTPLVGREVEEAQLQALLTRSSRSARGGCVVLRGEAGIGKTRLCEAAHEFAESLGMTTVRLHVSSFGEGDHRDLGRALGRRLAEILSPDDDDPDALIPILGEGLQLGVRVLFGLPVDGSPQDGSSHDPRWVDERRRESLAALLHSAVSLAPILCVIEDVHWAGSEQLQEITDVLDAARSSALVCILTVRQEDEPDSRVWRAALSRPGLTTLDLAPLDRESALELARLFGHVPGTTARDLAERACGNPLFLEQLVRRSGDAGNDGDEIPSTVASLVVGRLDRQPPEIRRAVEIAAVVGQRMHPDTLRALLAEDCTVRLREEGWLQLDGRHLRFVHALVRDAAYSTLHRDRRAELHRRVAEYYAATDPARQAEHLEMAGDEAAAAAYLTASRRSLTELDIRGALALADRGLGLHTGDDSATRYELALLSGTLHRRTGDTTGALPAYGEAWTLASDPPQRLAVLLGEAEALNLVERTTEAFERLDRATLILEDTPDDLWRARVSTLRGNFHFPRGEYDVCAAAQGDALELARRAGDPPAEARALSGLADAEYARGDLVRATELFTDVADLSVRRKLAAPELTARSMRGIIAVHLLALDDARRDLEWALQRAVQLGEARVQFVNRSGLALMHMTLGAPDEARSGLEATIDLAERLGAVRFGALSAAWLVRPDWQQGKPQATHERLLEVRETHRGTSENFWLGVMLGALALSAPDLDTRRGYIEEGRRHLGPRCPVHAHAGFYLLGIQAALESELWDEADTLADGYAAYVEGHPFGEADLVIARARLLAARGRGMAAPAAQLEPLRRRAEAAGVGCPLMALPD